jgi:RNA polymerase sigma-70 factor (ECF subfamily)
VVGRPRDEQALVEEARRGDPDAFAALVRAHQDVAFRTAMLITRNAADAEDAAQEAFVKAHRALHRFRPGEPWRPWLLAIVANEARNRRRSAGRRQALAARAAADSPEGAAPPSGGAAGGWAAVRVESAPDAALLSGERRAELLSALARLREDDQLVLGCRYLLDLSERETAHALGCRPGTVKSRTSRALDRLRTELGSREVAVP